MDLRAGVKRWGWRVAAAGVLMVAASCGGGGGGSSDPGGGGGNEPGSMVPPAPALGDTLYTDAAVLRPLVDGAKTVLDTEFRTMPRDTLQTGSRTYTISVRGDEFIEVMDNDLERTVRVVNGRVENVERADLSGLGEEDLTTIELRSPVRVGDQYVSIEKRYTETAIDVDGDRKTDQLDVAVYARVIGAQDYTPPGRPALKTVRVDTFLKVRTRASSTGEWSDPVQVVQRNWYAEGLGVVRQEEEEPDDESGVVFESLVGWIDYRSTPDRDWGPQPPVRLAWAEDSDYPGRTIEPVALARMGNDLIVMNEGPKDKLAYHRVDSKGRTLSSTLQSYDFTDVGKVVLPLDNHWAYIDVESIPGDPAKVQLTTTDALGNVLGDLHKLLDLSGGYVFYPFVDINLKAYAGGGRHVWVAWVRARPDPADPAEAGGCELLVRAWDLAGQPARPETRLATLDGDRCPFHELALSASADQAVVTWLDDRASTRTPEQWHGTVDLNGPRQTAAALGTVDRNRSVGATAKPLAVEGGGAVLVWDRVFAPLKGGPGAVRLLGDGTVVSSSADPLVNDRLNLATDEDTPFQTLVGGVRFLATTAETVPATVNSPGGYKSTVQIRTITGDDSLLAGSPVEWTTKAYWNAARQPPGVAVLDDYIAARVFSLEQGETRIRLQLLWPQ